MMNARLVAAKERWAAKMKARAAGAPPAPARQDHDRLRLPPGQHLTTDFPILDLDIRPPIDLPRWRLTVNGAVENPVVLDWEAFNALPQAEDTSDFHCVTTWSRYDCRWGGVPFTALVDLVRPLPEARFVFFTSSDGYSTNVPMEPLLDDDVLIATRFEGEPLACERGGPARVIVPKLYAWKGAKFVQGIEFLAAGQNRPGFWESRGYSDTADPWKEERFS
ncbi:MAG TPA: sulfite oxidase-like oxidoreductase [Candidatus Methylacidiphilales bacterium]